MTDTLDKQPPGGSAAAAAASASAPVAVLGEVTDRVRGLREVLWAARSPGELVATVSLDPHRRPTRHRPPRDHPLRT